MNNENSKQHLSGIAESLLLPLYIRGLETQHLDGLIKDMVALGLINKLGVDSTYIEKAQLSEEVRVSVLMHNCQFDLIATDFLRRHPAVTVRYIGWEPDARFEQVDNSKVE